MTADELRTRAIEHAKRGNFGTDAAAVNRALLAVAPSDAGAWTRLARCCITAGDFDGAVDACERALAISADNTIARNLLSEARKGRQFARKDGDPDDDGGFTLDVFDALGRQGERAVDVGERLESLLAELNRTRSADAIVGQRRNRGKEQQRLFHRGGLHWHSGQVYTFHRGGRWEPQFNIGVFRAHQWPTNCIRAGIGFNLTRDGMDPNPAEGQRRVIAYFRAFQQALRSRWRGHLASWMDAYSGAWQHGVEGPTPGMSAERQLDSILSITDPEAARWVFVGRWWYPDVPADYAALASLSELCDEIDATFRQLLPMWTDVWNNVDLD